MIFVAVLSFPVSHRGAWLALVCLRFRSCSLCGLEARPGLSLKMAANQVEQRIKNSIVCVYIYMLYIYIFCFCTHTTLPTAKCWVSFSGAGSGTKFCHRRPRWSPCSEPCQVPPWNLGTLGESQRRKTYCMGSKATGSCAYLAGRYLRACT